MSTGHPNEDPRGCYCYRLELECSLFILKSAGRRPRLPAIQQLPDDFAVARGRVTAGKIKVDVTYPSPGILITPLRVHYKLEITMQDTIMVVDDEESIRNMLTETFENADFSVLTASSAEEALDTIKEHNIQVYFLDLLLPEMNGVELCRRIRKAKPTSFVFAMTGYSSVFDLILCREAGFDDYFTKPFDVPLLIKTAKEAFTRLERWRRGT